MPSRRYLTQRAGTYVQYFLTWRGALILLGIGLAALLAYLASGSLLLAAAVVVLAAPFAIGFAVMDTHSREGQHTEASTGQNGSADVAPLISVIVTCENEAQHLDDCLQSVANQELRAWECIIVDDCSSGSAMTTAAQWTDRDPRFRLFRHKLRSGTLAARNTGMRLAAAPYLAFLDANSLLPADSLEARLHVLARIIDDAVAGSFAGSRKLDGAESAETSTEPNEPRPSGRMYADLITSGGTVPFAVESVLARAAVVRRFGGFSERHDDSATPGLWLRIMRGGYWFVPAAATSVLRRGDQAPDRELSEPSLPAATLTGCSPEPLTRSISEYEEEIAESREAIRASAAAALEGRDDDVEPALAALASVNVDLVRRHVDVASTIADGAASLPGPPPPSDPQYTRAAQQVLTATNRYLVRPPRSLAATTRQPSPELDVVFMPANAVQAQGFAAAAGSLGAAMRCGFLIAERIDGDQGATAVVERSGLAMWTINEWVLAEGRHTIAVVGHPRSATIDRLVNETIAAGGDVLELLPEENRINHLAESYWPRPPRTADAESSASAIAQLVTTHGAAPTPVAFRQPIPAQESFVAEPDPAFALEESLSGPGDTDRLAGLENIHRGERCVVIGNGPSLSSLDLQALRHEITFGVNGIFYAEASMGGATTYYMVEDTAFARENATHIAAYPARAKFFPTIYRELFGASDNTVYFLMNRGFYEPHSPHFCVPRFSIDPTQRLFTGQSVTIMNLQLAYYMGFTEVILIGMDFSYHIPADAEVDGALIRSVGPDPNHFHPDYFGVGKTWKDPRLDRVLPNYQLARAMYEADGRSIVNATPGGNLEVFDRVPFEAAIGA